MADVVMKRNDTYPPLEVELSDKNGPIDLTNVDKIHIYLKSDSLFIKTGTMIITDAVNGKAKYNWQGPEGEVPADLATSGTYHMEFEITWESGAIQTIPNTGFKEIQVVDDLGPES